MKDHIPSHSLFYMAGFFFPPVVLNQTKATMDKSLKCNTVESAIWRWKSLCEFFQILQGVFRLKVDGTSVF